MKRLGLYLCFILGGNVFGQTQSIAYPSVGKGAATTFVTDYHCLGINTSALGWGTGYEGLKKTLGTSEFAFGIYSDSLTSDKLKNLYQTSRDRFLGKSSTSFTPDQKKTTVADYAQAGISVFYDYNWAGFAFQGKRFGGIAFNINSSYQFYSKFNQQTTDILFRGNTSSLFDSLRVVMNGDTTMIANRDNISPDSLQNVTLGTLSIPLNISSITNGSSIRMVWNRSYNLGYGRKIIGVDSVFAIYGGIGGRYIQSMAMFNMESDENGLRMYSSVSSTKGINYNPSNFTEPDGLLPKVLGQGYGLDFSASVILLGKIKVAAAINNIGQVTYKRNVYTVKDTLMTSLSLSGLQNYDITQSVSQLLSTGGLLTLEGKESYVVKNAANFRFGASFQPWKFLHVGFDMVTPFDKTIPGSLQNPVYAFGGEIRPVKWLALSCGYYGGGVYDKNIPVGINFIFRDGAYEMGISSRDAVSFFNNNGHSISSALGFARMRF